MKHQKRYLVVAFLVALFTIFAGLGRLALLEPDEGRNAEVAREMNHASHWSRAWLIPTLNGLPYMDKPAFYFKTVALTFAAFGESEATARLSSALFAFGLLVMLCLFCRRVYGSGTAALAVLVVATAPLYIAFARLVIMDMALAFFVCAAIFSGYIAEEKQGAARRRWYWLATAAAGVATLVKGPIGFFLPLLVLTCFNLLDGKRDFWKRLFHPTNILLFLAIGLPWFLGACYYERGFAYYGLVHETALRLVTNEFNRNAPFYFFVPWVVIGLLAWSLLLPEGVVLAWKSRARWQRADRLFVVWSIATFIFFSLSHSKRPDYILTIMVSAGALIARIFDTAFEFRESRAASLVRRATVLFLLVTVLAMTFVGLTLIRPWLWRLFHVKPASIGWLTPYLPRTLMLMAIPLVLAGLARMRKDPRLAFCAFVLFTPLLFLGIFKGLEKCSDESSSRLFVKQLPQLPAHTEIACVGTQPTSLPFYLKRLVPTACDDGFELSSFYIMYQLKRSHPWPDITIPMNDFSQWVRAQKHPVFLVSTKREAPHLETIATELGTTPTLLGKRWTALIQPRPAN